MPVIDALMYAFIYARWSSLEQGKGTTLTRQLEVCRDYCRAQGWTIAGELRDEGRSAYTGENIRTGELGEFFRRSEQGLLPADSVLVIEQLDRLSRLPALEVLSYIQRVAAAGLTIATVNDKALINATTLKEDQLQIVGLVFNSFRAYGESKHKSDRLTEAWQIKRREYEAGKRKQLTTICPAWLRWNEDADRFDAIEDRVVVLNRIFDEADRGDGKRVIAARLNREGVPVWGRGANGWQPSYIGKLLTNPSVLGDYQPCVKPKAAVRRTPIGDPIKNYYPPVIDEALFARVNAQDKRRVGGSARKGQLNNLFSGIAKCGDCFGPMTYVRKGRAGAVRANRKGERVWKRRRDESYLVCDAALRGRPCGNKIHFDYQRFQDGCLDALLHLILDDAHFAKPDTVAALDKKLAAVRREAIEKRQRATRFLELFGDIGDEAAKGRYIEAKRAADEAEKQARELEAQLSEARGKVSPREHLHRVHNVRVALHDDNELTRYDARSRVMSAIQAMISYAHFYQRQEVVVTLQAGAEAMRFDRHGRLLARAGVDFANDEQMQAGLISGGASAEQLERLHLRRGKSSAAATGLKRKRKRAGA